VEIPTPGYRWKRGCFRDRPAATSRCLSIAGTKRGSPRNRPPEVAVTGPTPHLYPVVPYSGSHRFLTTRTVGDEHSRKRGYSLLATDYKMLRYGVVQNEPQATPFYSRCPESPGRWRFHRCASECTSWASGRSSGVRWVASSGSANNARASANAAKNDAGGMTAPPFSALR
jgi:hypothetical protein